MKKDTHNNHFSAFLAAMGGRRLLHLGHKDADCDALACAYTLSRSLPGDIGFAGGLKTSAMELANWLGVKPVIDPNPQLYEYTIIYDTYTPTLLDVPLPPAYALFDHHTAGGRPYVARENLLAAGADWQWIWPVEATSSILVDLFVEEDIDIDRKMAVALAAGIITDTNMLKIAGSSAFHRIANLLAPHGLYYADVLDVIDPPSKTATRRAAVVKAMQSIQELRSNSWSILATQTDSHDNGFAVMSALNRIGDIYMVSFPKGENAMLMVECNPFLVEETGIDLGEIIVQFGEQIDAQDAWGIPIAGRIIAPTNGSDLLQLCTDHIAQALNHQ
jgi:nanoRNase/pAp phosphatase (c-di-AMP/oligoRNAs hydrolase)